MRVITNTSPLLNLAAIGRTDILSKLFGNVCAPEAVLSEINSLRQSDLRFSAAVMDSRVTFVAVKNCAQITLLSLHLDLGEAEAIALALESNAHLLLLDERRATLTAKRLGIKTLGLLGVLLLAKRRGIITQVKPLLNQLTLEAGFWVAPRLISDVLAAAGE